MSGLILFLTVVGALFVSWNNARVLNAERGRYQEIVRSNWINQPDRHPHRVAHYGYLAFRPKSTLSFFDSGVDSYTGTTVFLEAHRQNSANFSEARHSNGLLRFGEFTVALIFQMIVPLAIFFLGYGAVAGERERGTLSLMRAQGTAVSSIIIGKTIGLLGIVAGLLAPLIAVSTVLWLFLIDFAVTTETAARILVLAAAYGAFYFVCAAATVIVSAYTGSSAKALTVLTVAWIVLWVAMPRTVQRVGSMLAPAPTKAEFERILASDLSKEGDSHNPDDPKFADLRRQLLDQYGVADVKDLPFNYNGYLMSKSEEISSQIFGRRFGELLATYKRQNRFSEYAGALNPFLALRAVSMSAAASDFTSYEHFGLQTEEFRYRMIQRLNDIHTHEIAQQNDRSQKTDADVWSDFPEFVYREPTLAETVGRQTFPIFSLAFWFAVSLVGIVFAGRRKTL